MLERVESVSGWVFLGAAMTLLLPSFVILATSDPVAGVVAMLVVVAVPGVVAVVSSAWLLVRRLRDRAVLRRRLDDLSVPS